MKQLIQILLVFLTFLFLSACSGTPAEEQNARPVQYAVVENSATQLFRTFSGKVEAGYEAILSFKVAGTLAQRPVNVGDTVNAQQLLASLDNRDYQIAVQQAQAALDLAQAQYRNKQADYERTKSLYENRNASKNDLDAARAGSESHKAQVESAQAQLEAAQLQLSYTEIKSPDQCHIAAVYFELNENIGQGQPVIGVNCGACPQVTVSVPETVINQIKPGDRVNVRAQAFPGQTFFADVKEVGIATGVRSATYPVRVELFQNCEQTQIRSGMAADVEFNFKAAEQYANNIIVPAVAVGEDKDGTFVFILQEDKEHPGYWRAHRRSVTVGDLTRMGLVITQGLTAGDYIATAGVKQLTEQEMVTLLK
ncbi:MAG: efflux RND transporter periplasmic adaptor subunit [Legionellales bacterium]|jgi:RND family efflux transporter MFP subunit